ncbi:MAG: 50S ribosomal protein L4 [Candidatus Buchananbacteria bacterium]|nr:50S ribosomal protein L4 [Candidatus Buchananbacteria bacterium]
MAKVKVYNLQGKETEELKLDSDIFAVKINPDLVYQVVEIQKSNARQNLAHAKTRAEVRGGGRKPWRQKGTGRARHGSTRSPIWIGGGVTFGPSNERNFVKKINKKMKRKALFMALTDKLQEKQLVVADKLELAEIKTKELANILSKLPTKEAKSVLLVLDQKNEAISKSAQNLPKINIILANSLNIMDILKHDYLLIDKAGITKITETFK